MSAEEITQKILEVADRFGGRNPQQLKQLKSVLSKRDAQEVFEGLFAVLCVEDGDTFQRQQLAGSLLYDVRPCVQFDLVERIRLTLSSWNRSIEEWPWYLVDLFGLDHVLKAASDLAATPLSEAESTRLETIVWWANGFRGRGEENTLGRDTQ